MTRLTYAVTGASRGIGLEFVRQIAANGHTVIALVRNPDTSDRLKSLVDNKTVYVVKLDATNEDTIKAAAEEVAKIAPEGIDVLINNAGVGAVGRIDEVTREVFLSMFETNVIGVNNTIRAFVPLLRKRGQDNVKKILNISSGLGSIEMKNRDVGNRKRPQFQMAGYDVSKAALNMVVKLWAGLLNDENFVVYSSHPGWVKTDMGSEDAIVEVDDSVAGQLAVLDKLTPAETGTFFDYTGRPIPW